jgi:hypothetical protein
MTLQELYQAKQAYYEDWSEEEALAAVKQDSFALQYVQNQTDAICLEAVKQNGFALQYVQNQIFKGLNFEIETLRDEFNKKLEVLEQK